MQRHQERAAEIPVLDRVDQQMLDQLAKAGGRHINKLAPPRSEQSPSASSVWLRWSHSFLAIVTYLTCALGVEGQSQPTKTNSTVIPQPELEVERSKIWEGKIGEGFLPTVQNFDMEAGVALGMATFGSQQAHDLALLSFSYGHMVGRVVGRDHWYRGNFEGRLELFGGMQFHPGVDTDGWLVGLTPHLRYNFATGIRLIPFLDGGAGVSATGIGPPDLGGTFEFNLQATAGAHWFLRDNLALTGDVRYMHLSCAGIHQPNIGMNNVVFFLGVTWFFGK